MKPFFLRFTVTLLHSNLDEKITSNEENVTSKEQNVTSKEQKLTSNKQKVMSKEQKVTSHKQRAKSSASYVTMESRVSADNIGIKVSALPPI